MGKRRYPSVDYIDAFKLDHLQPAELILFHAFSPSYRAKEWKGEAAEAENGKREVSKSGFH